MEESSTGWKGRERPETSGTAVTEPRGLRNARSTEMEGAQAVQTPYKISFNSHDNPTVTPFYR